MSMDDLSEPTMHGHPDQHASLELLDELVTVPAAALRGAHGPTASGFVMLPRRAAAAVATGGVFVGNMVEGGEPDANVLPAGTQPPTLVDLTEAERRERQRLIDPVREAFLERVATAIISIVVLVGVAAGVWWIIGLLPI